MLVEAKIACGGSMRFLSLLVFLSILPASGLANPNRVKLNLVSETTIEAGKATLQFTLIDTQTNQPLSANSLQVSHEKLLHVLIYDLTGREYCYHLQC